MTDMLATDPTPEATVPPAQIRTAPTNRRPGALKGDVQLTLHTREAALLLLGRQATDDVRAIPSINNFAFNVDQIITAARSGDIYAFQALVAIDGQLDAAERQLRYELNKARAMLSSSSRFSVVPGESTDPNTYSIRLTSPYAHCAARLVGLFDEVVATGLTARHVGMLPYSEFEAIQKFSMKAVRAIYHWAGQFRVSGVTIDDVLQDNARATEAAELRGPILPAIREGQTKPAFLH